LSWTTIHFLSVAINLRTSSCISRFA
jgi:hypothetical protein